MSADRKSLNSFSPCHVPGLSRVGGTLGGQLYGLENGGEGSERVPWVGIDKAGRSLSGLMLLLEAVLLALGSE